MSSDYYWPEPEPIRAKLVPLQSAYGLHFYLWNTGLETAQRKMCTYIDKLELIFYCFPTQKNQSPFLL